MDLNTWSSNLKRYVVFVIPLFLTVDQAALWMALRRNFEPNDLAGILYTRLYLKQQCHVVFSAIFNKAGLKPWLSTTAHTGNAPRTSRERYQVSCWRKVELSFILSYFFQVKMQTLKRSGWIFQVQSSYCWHNGITFLHLHYTGSYFYENVPLLAGFRCCKCVFALLKFWHDARDPTVPLMLKWLRNCFRKILCIFLNSAAFLFNLLLKYCMSAWDTPLRLKTTNDLCAD